MGAETTCTAHFGGRSSVGKAALESQELLFKGEFRLKIPVADITKIAVEKDCLCVTTARGTAAFDLGRSIAEKWLDKVKNPKSLLDKLGVKSGQRVAVIGVDDAAFLEDLSARVGDFSRGRAPKGCDSVFLGMSNKKDLARLKTIEKTIDRAGAVWVIWPKGKPELREDDIRAAALALDLVDVKVAKFSETHSALRLVIRKERR
jgi:hypothetical protein